LGIPEEHVSLNHLGLGTGRRLTIALLATLLLASAMTMLRGARASGEARDAKTAPVTGLKTGMQATSVGAWPLFFEPNQGQTDPRVKFMARGSGYGLFLTANEAVLKLGSSKVGASSAVAMRLEGANAAANVRGSDALPGKSNYLVGNDPKRWRSGISQFARVEYEQIYPGVDLVYYGNQGMLEYDFRVAPGADASRIAMSFEGAESIKLSQVSVELKTAAGDVRFEAPRVYQKFGDEERPVEGHFVQLAGNRVGFKVGDYDRSRTLVIDPVLSYSTYLGGTGDEVAPAIAVDSGLNFYVAGTTTSTDFPVTAGVIQTALSGTSDAFIAKFDPSGALLFATYLGGSGTETVAGIGVDGGFNVYVGGTTTSGNFPPSAGAFQSTPKTVGSHVFVSQVNSTGTGLLYSTYLSGSGTDLATGFAIDNRGNAYVTGTTTSSTDFPVTAGAFAWPPANPAIQFFVTKVSTTNSGDSSLAYSSFFGGAKPVTGQAIGGGIAVDSSGNIYFTGSTNFQFLGTVTDTTTTRDLNDFPILNATQPCLDTPTPVPPPSPAPACVAGLTAFDAFVAKITPPTGGTGPQLVYSTYLGGTADDEGVALAVDSANNAYVTGTTASADLSTSIPTPTASFQKTLGGGTDAFIAKIGGAKKSTTVSIFPLNYLSYLGGSAEEKGLAITADSVQGVRVTGSTASANFPKLNPIQNALAGGIDAFVARIDTTATTATSAGQWATFLGGSGNDVGTGVAVDANNQTYVAGQTASGNFPTKNPFQAAIKGTSDAFITKIGAVSTLTLVGVPTPTTVGVGNTLTFKYTITNTGPDPAFNVNFNDVLPGSGTTFSSATASPGSCTGATGTPAAITCAIGTLAVNGTATVSIVVTPTTVAPSGIGNSATVTFNNGSTVTATVNPIPIVTDFRIDVSPSTATVVAGNTATYTATVTPLPTYSGSVALSCSSGLPAAATCTITSSPVTIPNASPVTAQLAIATTARPVTTSQSQFGGFIYALWLPIGGFALMGSGMRRRRWLAGLFLLALVAFVGLQLGCGSSGTTPPVTSGTPAGTYTVTVSASSGSASRSTTLTLVVQ
jgi:uncharacterized repeat protein (TIGR01451 family)